MKEPYRPREDTFLLANAVSRYTSTISLEIGVGTGLIMAEMARRASYVVGTDIDINSLKEAKERLKGLGLWANSELIICDRASALRDCSFTLVAFNPPYLEDEGIGDPTIEGGYRVIRLWLDEALRVAKRGGLLLLISPEREGQILEDSKVVGEARLFFERIRAIAIRKG